MWHARSLPGTSRRKRGFAPRHRRLCFEPLEDRSLLAQLVNTGTAADMVFTLPAAAGVVYLEDDLTLGNGISQLRSTNGTFDTTTFVNPTGSLTIHRGTASDSLSVSALPDFNASLVIGSAGAEFASIAFAGGLALAANNSLSANATGAIALPNSTSNIAISGSGSVSLTTAQSISLSLGSSITSVNGNVTLSANQQVTPTSGNFMGVSITSAMIQTTGIGAITIQGKGGDDSSLNQDGVYIRDSATIRGGTKGPVMIRGTGGASPSGSASGVWISTSSVFFGPLITSAGADVQIVGQGGGA
jgi:hypothetical protein